MTATDEAKAMTATHQAQPSSAETHSVVLQPVFEPESYTALSSENGCPSEPSSLDAAQTHMLSSPASAADPAIPSTSSHAGQDSQAAAAEVLLTTDALTLADIPGVTATEQMVDADGTADVRPVSPGAVLPDPAAENDIRHEAVALHKAAGSEVTPSSRHNAASGSVQTSFGDSAAAAGTLISCATDVHLTGSTQDATPENIRADSTAGQPMFADSAEVDVQQPTFAHSSAADGSLTSLDSTILASDSEASAAGTQGPSIVLRLPHAAAGHKTAPVTSSLPRLAASTHRVGMAPSVMARMSAFLKATLMPAQQSQDTRDKGKGRASAADLERMAVHAEKTVESSLNQAKLTQSQIHQLRVAHQEAEFMRRVEAGKRAGAGPSRVRSSVMAGMLHAAADMAYYVAGAVKGSCEGLLRAFWRPLVY